MTIQEKAKAYDETISKAREIYAETESAITAHALENIFPGLAESEDEKIWKEIIRAVNLYCTSYHTGEKVREDMLAWLEKQKPAEWRDKLIPKLPSTLEEAAEEYAYKQYPSQGVANIECEQHFKAGAEWAASQLPF